MDVYFTWYVYNIGILLRLRCGELGLIYYQGTIQ